jgi:excisionase family DNA binding protein
MRRYGRDEEHELLTTEEAARYLRVSRRTLTRWIKEGKAPPSIKLPGRRLYKRSDLDRFIEERREDD